MSGLDIEALQLTPEEAQWGDLWYYTIAELQLGKALWGVQRWLRGITDEMLASAHDSQQVAAVESLEGELLLALEQANLERPTVHQDAPSAQVL